ncbi:MAG TPA: PD-(D/E)XK nuclease family protein, partial [Longimicrobiales bacterium]|nr:PD-(D/E)XK nuclease family protein [Longimicrobiales bacterium]
VTGGVSHAFPPMKKDVRALLEPLCPELAGASRQQRAGQVRDALSGLYVAMTRARHALHMIIPAEPDKPAGGATPARLLRDALCNRIDPASATETGDVIHETGSADWMSAAPPPRERVSAAAPGGPPTGVSAPIHLRDAPRRRMLPRRRPSDHEPRHERERAAEDPSPVDVRPEPAAAGSAVDLDRLLGLEGWDREGIPATVRGSVVHAWMEAVEWLEDGLPDEALRRRLARREAPELSETQLSTLLGDTWEWLQDRLSAPAMREALTLEGAARSVAEAHLAAELVVERELPFYRREGDALVEGIIDRLVLVREEGRVVAAHVLDYKTDAVAPTDEVRLRERTELYAPQLLAYRAAVAASYRIPPEAVRLTLLFLEAGKAVAVGEG